MPPKEKAASGVAALNTQLDGAILVVEQFRDYTDGIFRKADGARAAVAARDVDVVEQLEVAAASTAASAATPPPASVDALALASDAARLVRAHATKISLLIINEPFMPSAVSQVVQQLTAGPVASLAQAAELCNGSRYTRRIRRDLALRCTRVLAQVLALLQAVPRDGRVVAEAQRVPAAAATAMATTAGSSSSSSRGSFAQIGILWAECDELVAFAKLGVQGRLIQIVEQLTDTLQDELNELKEWGEEQNDEEDEEDEEDGADSTGSTDAADDNNPHAATQALLDQLMNAGGHISAADPTRMRPRLELALKKMRLVILFCRAVVKRRLRTLPALPGLPTRSTPAECTRRLDNGVAVLQRIPERFGDLAAAFYEMNVADVDATMLRCFEDAFAASEILVRPWEATAEAGGADGAGSSSGSGSSDAFTVWVAKFQAEMRATLGVIT